MTIDIEHNGTHILNESDVRRLIDEREELAAALDAIHAHCVAGSADPRPGVARSSVIRIGEICEEHDYAPRLFARLAAERKAGWEDGWISGMLHAAEIADTPFCGDAARDIRKAAQIERGESKPPAEPEVKP